MRRHSTPDEAANLFWRKVDKCSSPHGCWLWTAHIFSKTGYGAFSFQGQMQSASRVAWLLTFGEIPDGLEVCHDCPGGDNRSCVNPAHLFLATHLQNMRDKVAKGKGNGGAKNPMAVLTEDGVSDIRSSRAQKVKARVLAERYGVSEQTICDIVKRRTWGHVA